MKNKTIRFAAVLLIAVLFLSLASCRTANGTTTAAPTTLTQPQIGVETRGDVETSVEPTNAPATKAEPTMSADPTATSEPTTDSEPTESPDYANMDYEKYSNLTSEQQYEYFLTFSDPAAFLLWFNEQKDIYDKEHPVVVVEPGDTIDIGN